MKKLSKSDSDVETDTAWLNRFKKEPALCGTIPHYTLEQAKMLGHRAPGSTYTRLNTDGTRWTGAVHWNHGLFIWWRNERNEVVSTTLI